MKRFVLASLTTLALYSSSNISTVKAEPLVFNAYSNHQTIINAVTPFELVTAAKSGQFINEGIPSYGAFTTAYIEGKVTAEKLIQVAIKTNRLQGATANDPAYLNNVKLLLQFIDNVN